MKQQEYEQNILSLLPLLLLTTIGIGGVNGSNRP